MLNSTKAKLKSCNITLIKQINPSMLQIHDLQMAVIIILHRIAGKVKHDNIHKVPSKMLETRDVLN